MTDKRTLMAAIAASLAVAGSAGAANIATEGTGISGIFTSGGDLNGPGTPFEHAGTAANLNDGLIGTRVDTWGDPNAIGVQTDAYIGITWAAPRTDLVQTVTVSPITFQDGGWFGVNGATPGPGGALVVGTHITAATTPGLQVTLDGGSTWSDIASTTDYLTVMGGHTIGGGANPNPNAPGDFTFTLDTPVTGINGLRVIGPVGGSAGGQVNGFLAAAEVVIDAQIPEPSAPALLGLVGGMCFAMRRRRRGFASV